MVVDLNESYRDHGRKEDLEPLHAILKGYLATKWDTYTIRIFYSLEMGLKALVRVIWEPK